MKLNFWVEEGCKGITAPNAGDAGYDIYTAEDAVLKPQEIVRIKTGLRLEIPEGYAGVIKEKSSVSGGNKRYPGGIAVLAGLIDPSYRGEVIICLQNLSSEEQSFPRGTKIVQLIIVPFIAPELNRVDTLTETTRGEGGFGSTGTQ